MLRTQKKTNTRSNISAHHLRGEERGWKEWTTVAARTERKNRLFQRKPDINLTTFQPRGNKAVAMRYVPVIIHIRRCYVNLYDMIKQWAQVSIHVMYLLNETMKYLTSGSCTPQTSTLATQ